MLLFLKLGGSLITDKNVLNSARREKIKSLGGEIKKSLHAIPELNLLIGHGSGSFGHATADQFGTHTRIQSQEDWHGFHQVWWAARKLNQIVTNIFIDVGLNVTSLPASAAMISNNRLVQNWNIVPIKSSLKNNLIPLIYGDVIFDLELGATIFSTEDLFAYLAKQLHPNRILLAGKDRGVFLDYPKREELISTISLSQYPDIKKKILESESIDVTGGMASKISTMLELLIDEPDLAIDIFSGENEENLSNSIAGKNMGTRLQNDPAR